MAPELARDYHGCHAAEWERNQRVIHLNSHFIWVFMPNISTHEDSGHIHACAKLVKDCLTTQQIKTSSLRQQMFDTIKADSGEWSLLQHLPIRHDQKHSVHNSSFSCNYYFLEVPPPHPNLPGITWTAKIIVAISSMHAEILYCIWEIQDKKGWEDAPVLFKTSYLPLFITASKDGGPLQDVSIAQPPYPSPFFLLEKLPVKQNTGKWNNYRIFLRFPSFFMCFSDFLAVCT